MGINDFINKNYNKLLAISKNITHSHVNENEIKHDLLSFTCLLIIESGKYDDMEEKEFIYLFANVMKSQYSWRKNGEFWRQMDGKKDFFKADKLDGSDIEFIDIMMDCKDECEDDEFELHETFGGDNAKKIKHIRLFEKTLPPHKRILYDLYFTQRLSMRKISEKVKMPLKSVFNSVDELKKQIKESWMQSQ